MTKSARDPARLAGEAPDGILGCEAAQLPYDVFLRLRGRVAERRGWLWLSGTFEGSRGWYADHFSAWQAVNADGAASFSIPTWSNRALFPGGRADAEIEALEATYPAAVFRERFGGVPLPRQRRWSFPSSNRRGTWLPSTRTTPNPSSSPSIRATPAPMPCWRSPSQRARCG